MKIYISDVRPFTKHRIAKHSLKLVAPPLITPGLASVLSQYYINTI